MKKSIAIVSWTVIYGIFGFFIFKMSPAQYWTGFVFGAGWVAISSLIDN